VYRFAYNGNVVAFKMGHRRGVGVTSFVPKEHEQGAGVTSFVPKERDESSPALQCWVRIFERARPARDDRIWFGTCIGGADQTMSIVPAGRRLLQP
jgi:hypothetical protein